MTEQSYHVILRAFFGRARARAVRTGDNASIGAETVMVSIITGNWGCFLYQLSQHNIAGLAQKTVKLVVFCGALV